MAPELMEEYPAWRLVTSGKVSLTELDTLRFGDMLKLNALLDMEEDMQAGYREYLNSKNQKKG